jgi:hypothetical protein
MAIIIIVFLFPLFEILEGHPNNFRKKDSGGRSELDRNTVHAVALIGWRLEAFSLEHMAQMPATSSAYDFYTTTIRVSLNTPQSDIQYVIQRK